MERTLPPLSAPTPNLEVPKTTKQDEAIKVLQEQISALERTIIKALETNKNCQIKIKNLPSKF